MRTATRRLGLPLRKILDPQAANWSILAKETGWWYQVQRSECCAQQPEGMLYERATNICHKTALHWWDRSGPLFAPEQGASG